MNWIAMSPLSNPSMVLLCVSFVLSIIPSNAQQGRFQAVPSSSSNINLLETLRRQQFPIISNEDSTFQNSFSQQSGSNNRDNRLGHSINFNQPNRDSFTQSEIKPASSTQHDAQSFSDHFRPAEGPSRTFSQSLPTGTPPPSRSSFQPFGYSPPVHQPTQSNSAFSQSSPGRSIFQDGQGTPSSTVSPFWKDPEGRPAPRPPVIVPDDLTNTRVPCGSLNTSIAACDPFQRYRTVDGSCNNVDNPTFGMAMTVMQRMFRNRADPTMMRRLATNGGLLPNPRVVSEALRGVRPLNTQGDNNLMFMVLGQYLDHDLVSIPVSEDHVTLGINQNCRDCSSWINYPACAPIPIPRDDAFFQGQNRPACLPFTRSVGIPVQGSSGRVYLENINMNTAFMDLSTVYGSHDCLTKRLRSFRGGRLLTSNVEKSPYGLPVLTPSEHFAICKAKFAQCYLAGDERSNEHVGLLTIHTVFLREHNHVASQLQKLNPSWDDEKLFQETRRLVIAFYQHIVMNEFLPILLGPSNPLIQRYRLQPNPSPSVSEVYQPQSNGQILHEFAGAAFRVGHTFIPEVLVLSDANLRPMSTIPLPQVYNDPSIMTETNKKGTMYDALLRGLLSTRLEGSDLLVSNSIRDHLFVNPGQRFSGQDLFAINIARGRDHGLAPYTSLRQSCNLPAVESWDQLESLIPPDNVERLRRVYDHWDDIDLFVGGLAENVVPDGLVGPTFACIIALQFYIAKISDRFWYDGSRNGLQPEELETVYQSGQLSKMLARNIDNPDSLIPRNALKLPNVRSNRPVIAGEFPSINLRPWEDPLARRPQRCHFRGREYDAGTPVQVSPCLDCSCTPEGVLHCEDRLLDCGALVNFVPEARTDEHCHRMCPSPVHDGPLQRPPPPPPPSPPRQQIPRNDLHRFQFFQRNANSNNSNNRRNPLSNLKVP